MEICIECQWSHSACISFIEFDLQAVCSWHHLGLQEVIPTLAPSASLLLLLNAAAQEVCHD